MKSTLLQSVRRWIFVLVVAAMVAASATYAPILLDELAGATITPAAFACTHTGGGC
ncbi:MAG: hypothetical protein R3C14_21940 [Caldilineaceae bacterium]